MRVERFKVSGLSCILIYPLSGNFSARIVKIFINPTSKSFIVFKCRFCTSLRLLGQKASNALTISPNNVNAQADEFAALFP